MRPGQTQQDAAAEFTHAVFLNREAFRQYPKLYERQIYEKVGETIRASFSTEDASVFCACCTRILCDETDNISSLSLSVSLSVCVSIFPSLSLFLSPPLSFSPPLSLSLPPSLFLPFNLSLLSLLQSPSHSPSLPPALLHPHLSNTFMSDFKEMLEQDPRELQQSAERYTKFQRLSPELKDEVTKTLRKRYPRLTSLGMLLNPELWPTVQSVIAEEGGGNAARIAEKKKFTSLNVEVQEQM